MRRDGVLTLRACFKTRPVRAPGLQKARIVTEFCRPRALTRRFAGVFKHALKWQMKRGGRVPFWPILVTDEWTSNETKN